MTRDVAIVHYNTPHLTTALVASLRKFSPECRVTVFDNSDRYRFPRTEGVRVIDNTRSQIVNFDLLLARYPAKLPTVNDHASAKHIASVDKLFDYLPDGFVLMDSDVLVKADISPLFDESVPWSGMVEHPKEPFKRVRLAPYLLWINVPMCREKGIRFMSEGRIYKLSYGEYPYYDTAASLYEDWQKAGIPGCEVDIFQYVEHYGGGSYRKGFDGAGRWLETHKTLFDMQKKETTKKPGQAKDKVLVVIPYCSEGAQGRELEYAVAGWRRHFKEDFLIVVAGEDHPVTKTGDDIICIPSERVPEKEGQYRQHLDYVSCFKKVREAFPGSKGFVFVADDCYPVNDFDLTDVKFLKQEGSDITYEITSTNAWRRDAAKTKALLVKEGYPTRNFTTHVPQWYEWDKLEALWKKYKMGEESYVMEDLYFNIYYPTRVPLQLNIDFENLKCGVYRSNPRVEYIERAFREKLWITNSPDGWVPVLDRMLNDYYFGAGAQV